MQDCVKRIRRLERWESIRASIGKLKSKINKIPMNVKARNHIDPLMRDMSALRAKIIVKDTMHRLKRGIQDKKSILQVDRKEVRDAVEETLRDVLGFITREDKLRRELKP